MQHTGNISPEIEHKRSIYRSHERELQQTTQYASFVCFKRSTTGYIEKNLLAKQILRDVKYNMSSCVGLDQFLAKIRTKLK